MSGSTRLEGERAFALVLALVLMSFVLTLLLAITSMVRVESAVSKQSTESLKARQNALLAVYVALGELQETAGVDTRTTGSAALFNNPSTAPYDSAERSGHTHWVGVWDAAQMRSIDDSSSNNGSTIYNTSIASFDSAKRKPEAIRWLVSGETSAGQEPRPDLELSDEVTIVGSGSVNDTSEDGVDVGLESVGETDAFAYWVADESLKARFGVVEPESLINATSGSEEEQSRILAAQGLGLGWAYSNDNDATPELFADIGYNTDTPNERALLRKTHSLSAAPVDIAYQDALKERFHDLSFYSRGLLTNPVAGGLKKDLSAYLQIGAGLTDDESVIDLNRFPDLHEAGENLPRWGRLKSWTAQPSPLQPTIGDDLIAGISPTITFAGFDVGMSLNVDQLFVHLIPQIAIWNPYNERLQAPDGYTVTFRIAGGSSSIKIKDIEDAPADGSTPEIYGDETWLSSGSNVTGYNIEVGERLAAEMGIGSPGWSDYTQRVFLRFHLDDGAGVTLEPGEVAVYTLDAVSPLTGDPLTMVRGRVEPFANNPSIKFLAETLAPAPRDLLNFTFDQVFFDWADVRLLPGRVTADPPPTDCLTRLFYASWGNAASDVVSSLNPSAGDAGLSLRNYTGRLNLRPFSYQKNNVWPSFESYSALRGLSQYNFRADYIPKIHSGGTSYDSSDIPGSAQTFTKECGPFAFNNGEFAFPLSQSSFENGYVPWALFGSDPDSASVNVARQSSFVPVYWHPEGADRLLSIGNLQHAPWARQIWQPSYPVGNSFADPLIRREHYSGLFDEAGYDYQNPNDSTEPNKPDDAPDNSHIDLSYLLNASLWDDYFLSGFPAAGGRLSPSAGQLLGSEVLPNARHQVRKVDGLDYGEGETQDAEGQFVAGASHFFIDAPFNVNSTSIEAWVAFLSSSFGIPINGNSNSQGATFSRMPNPGAGSGVFFDSDSSSSPIAEDPLAYNGARRLDPSEIRRLAGKIVEEVRLRGPFLGMGDFVNRRLLPASDDPAGTGLRGAIQAAIDKSGINADFIDAAKPQTFFTENDFRPEHVLPAHALAGEARYATSAGLPGFLMQGDILSALGSVAVSRGDTFVIRGYGRSVDPLSSEIKGEAWCEAVVQRDIEYVSPADAPWEDPQSLDPVNAVFGRKFRILSIRWLDKNDI
jgi:hypothetical protein